MKTKNFIKIYLKRKPVQLARHTVQVLFSLFLLYVGLRFYQFYVHFATGAGPFVERPAAVEGFLPISALVSLKVWILTGEFDTIHPAGLVLFMVFVGSGFLLRKSFCSWFCPIGTISEFTGALGQKILGRTFNPPQWIAYALYSLKYLLLFFFIKIIVFDMPVLASAQFLQTDYNKVSDVKMLLFFLDLSYFSLKVILVLLVLSLFIKNFWCRYLCPYGALIGLGSLFGITKIKRNENTCISCHQCTRVCPQGIRVSEKKAVHTPECSACMQCVEACPIKDTLNMTVGPKKVNKWVVPAGFILLFALSVLVAKLTGHWETSIPYEEFKFLIPYSDSINH